MAPNPDTAGAKSSIQVIEHMINLLDALATHAGAVNLKQPATITALNCSTARRILSVMVSSRIVERVEQRLYRLRMRLLELRNLVKARKVRQFALPQMQMLHQLLDETVNRSLRQGDEIVCLGRIA